MTPDRHTFDGDSWLVLHRRWRQDTDPDPVEIPTDRALHHLARPVVNCGGNWAGRHCTCELWEETA